MTSFIISYIVLVAFIFTIFKIMYYINNIIHDLLCYISSYINKTQPTTRNYWINMNLCDEYAEEIQKINNLKEEKIQEIKNLQSSLRKSTLRNRNKNVEYATEEDVQQAREELQDIKQTLRKLCKYQDTHYLKTKEITREMNRRGMWELSS